MQDEIWRELARAKYLEWELGAAERAARVDAVETKLRQLGWDAARGMVTGTSPGTRPRGRGWTSTGTTWSTSRRMIRPRRDARVPGIIGSPSRITRRSTRCSARFARETIARRTPRLFLL